MRVVVWESQDGGCECDKRSERRLEVMRGPRSGKMDKKGALGMEYSARSPSLRSSTGTNQDFTWTQLGPLVSHVGNGDTLCAPDLTQVDVEMGTFF